MPAVQTITPTEMHAAHSSWNISAACAAPTPDRAQTARSAIGLQIVLTAPAG
ncbi:hypothetical protein XAPC_3428 [Xanthomonas citri pv. punicae str. LMG 859]|nr:hypothetical protein XAPC_3428 [Xanthomonas citri pv. punicae str. LMG 859]